MKRVFLPAITALFVVACGSHDSPATDGTLTDTTATAPASVTGQVVDLAAHDLPLLLTAPDAQLTGGLAPEVVWKDQTGLLEIRAGEHFGLTIVEEPGDIARKKGDLDRDLLRKNTILRESPGLLVYRSEFPDDPSLVYIHFHQVVKAGDRTFVVEDIAELQFNEQDVERMVSAIAPKQPA